ncbi:MAG: GNAT family N-acetyltransferase [Bauldia sp.]|nr:GNAT family N-acetyltransferase [Bauldia sp.]
MQHDFSPLDRPLVAELTSFDGAVGSADFGEVVLSVHARPEAIESVWRGFEATAVKSVYQRYEWVQAWCEHAAPGLRVEPVIVLGSRRGRPVMILPLGRRKTRGGRVVEWLGCSHVNIGMGVFDRSFAASLDKPGARKLLAAVIAAIAPVDIVALRNQPLHWNGVANPFAALPGRIADQPVLAIALQPEFETMLAGPEGAKKRKKMRWQANALAPAGGHRFIHATDRATALALLDDFLRQKNAQFAEAGITNVFANAGTIDFFRALVVRSLGHAAPLIELYGVEIEGSVRATFAAGIDDGRLHGYFSGMNLDEYQRVSPGELLLGNLIRHSCERGLGVVDLGVGEDRYKSSWHPVREEQFATFLGASARGRLAVTWHALAQSARVRIRANKTAWALVRKIRRTKASLTREGGEE